MPALRLPFNISKVEDLAIPAVSVLISFLAYTSQFLFYHIEPEPLSQKDAIWFNIVVAAIWWSYYNACTVDPGQKGWVERFAVKTEGDESEEVHLGKGMRWCRKCETVKPPRAHHCRKCKRYDRILPCIREHLLKCIDVYQRWTTTALGLRIVYPILHFHTSSASYPMLSSECRFWPTICIYASW
jgi:hypothetical protein